VFTSTKQKIKRVIKMKQICGTLTADRLKSKPKKHAQSVTSGAVESKYFCKAIALRFCDQFRRVRSERKKERIESVPARFHGERFTAITLVGPSTADTKHFGGYYLARCLAVERESDCHGSHKQSFGVPSTLTLIQIDIGAALTVNQSVASRLASRGVH
jgi:hypothetical protein